MPNLKASIKDIRKSRKRTKANRSHETIIKNYIKKITNAKKLEEAKKYFDIVLPLIDKAAKNNLFHKNKASRLKSRLSKHLHQLSLGTKKLA